MRNRVVTFYILTLVLAMLVTALGTPVLAQTEPTSPPVTPIPTQESDSSSNTLPAEDVNSVFSETATTNISDPYTFTFPVVRPTDDAGVNPLGCTYSVGHNEIYLGACPDGTDIISGLRFENVTIPQGAVISEAYLELTRDGPYTAPITVFLLAENTSNAATFSTINRPNNRLVFPQQVDWVIPATERWVVNESGRSPDISLLVQQIVNQSDWQSGNALAIILRNGLPTTQHRRIFAYERPGSSGTQAARLVVKLQPPVSLRITDATGQEVDGLALNNEGWPVLNANGGTLANPVRIQVTINETGIGDTLRLQLGSTDTSARFYVISEPDAGSASPQPVPCGSSVKGVGTNPFSYNSFRQDCLFTTSGVSFTWRVWVQPSAESTLNVTATTFDTDPYTPASQERSLNVPRAAIHPILFIPGITSTQPPMYNQADADFLLFGADQSFGANYNALYKTWEILGYEKNRTYFRFPYNWLRSPMESAERLRNDVILPMRSVAATVEWAASWNAPQGVTYDLITHSGGALVARSYIQSNFWQGYVRRFISIAGTHQGLTEAYTLLEGAFEQDNAALNTIVNFWGDQAALNAGYGAFTANGTPYVTRSERYFYAHDPVNGATALPDLLPTYAPYLVNLQNQAYPFGRLVNPLLEDNPTQAGQVDPYTDIPAVAENLQQRYGQVPATTYYGLNGSRLNLLTARLGQNLCLIYAGDDGSSLTLTPDKGGLNDTRTRLFVDPREARAPFWWTGKQIGRLYGPGDDLVPGISANPPGLFDAIKRPGLASLDLDDPSISNRLDGVASHRSLSGLGPVQPYMTQCLTGVSADFLDSTLPASAQSQVQPTASVEGSKGLFLAKLQAQQAASTTDVTERVLVVTAQGPVELLLTDPQNRRTGFDAQTGTTLRDIPLSSYVIDPDRGVKYVTVYLPVTGDYTLTIRGVGAGPYQFASSYYDASGRVMLRGAASQSSSGMAVEHTLTLLPRAIDTPQPPEVSAGSDTSSIIGEVTRFTGAFTDINVNDTHVVSWDFGDGQSTTGALISTNTYSNTGTYVATLTVTDNTGFSASDSIRITVTAPPAPTAPVRPVLECVVNNGNGSYTAWFGYRNDNSSVVGLPVGTSNRFSPNPQNRGQPTIFQPGRQVRVFRVDFNGSNLVWTLYGRTSTASSSSAPCR